MTDEMTRVGGIVIYKPTADEIERVTGFERLESETLTEWPAIVTWVFTERIVNLKVFGDGPKDLWITNATQGEEIGQWHWPVTEG